MREVTLRIPRRAAPDVLDRLLPIVPGGVREVGVGRHVELRMRGPELPSAAALRAAAGPWPHRLSERELPDDWRERRRLDYEPDVIGGRLVVRPDWAPATTRAGAIEIVLEDGPAFGAGTHPTTRACLEALLELPPSGGFADLGCGTGVLAILAAKLGFSPVMALDVDARSVAAARANAARNRVEVRARLADLSADDPPTANAFAANVPATLHAALAEHLPELLPRAGILSGFAPGEADAVSSAYAARKLGVRRRLERGGWCILVLKRD